MIPNTIGALATLVLRLCGKVFGFVKRNLSGAQRRKNATSGERGAGKGAAALVPASAHRNPSANSFVSGTRMLAANTSGTIPTYSKDVAAYLMWMAEPHLNATKAAGFRVLTFLFLFAVLMYLVKNRIWRNAH